MRTATTTIASLAVLFLWMTIAKASAVATEEDNNNQDATVSSSPFVVLQFDAGDDYPLLELLPTADGPQPPNKDETSSVASSSSSSSLRGKEQQEQQLRARPLPEQLPPIPPIHPVHTGVVKYSSVMETDGTVVYRRDIHAPCDYGMLIFNIGPSKDDLPYHFDLYGDAYLWSDNGGLCILYPTYTGYQFSPYGPFWTPGYDPTTIRFKNLVSGFKHIHKISSRMLVPPNGAPQHSKEINRNRAGDYVMMAKHNFYSIDYYKELKAYINSWGPNGPNDINDNNGNDNNGNGNNEDGWMVWDATVTE